MSRLWRLGNLRDRSLLGGELVRALKAPVAERNGQTMEVQSDQAVSMQNDFKLALTLTLSPRRGNPAAPRWELPLGESGPKDTKGQDRPTTLRDARKLGLFPSVTNITGIIQKEGISQWKMNHCVEAALTLPRRPGEDLSAFALRVAEDAEAALLERGRGVAAVFLPTGAGGREPAGSVPALQLSQGAKAELLSSLYAKELAVRCVSRRLLRRAFLGRSNG